MKQLEAQATKAKIASDIGNAQEQRTQAIENMANATLDRMKTLVEMGKLRDEHVMQLVEFVRNLERGEQVIPSAKPRKVLEFTRR